MFAVFFQNEKYRMKTSKKHHTEIAGLVILLHKCGNIFKASLLLGGCSGWFGVLVLPSDQVWQSSPAPASCPGQLMVGGSLPQATLKYVWITCCIQKQHFSIKAKKKKRRKILQEYGSSFNYSSTNTTLTNPCRIDTS